MNNGVVASNKLQQKWLDNTHEHLAPDPFAGLETPCTIITVYDHETLEEEPPSPELAQLLTVRPGWLFALVRLDSTGKKLILPFRDPEDHIYFVYGNRVMLEGRKAMVCYINQNPENGTIVLQRNHRSAHLPLGKLSQVYDIGRLV